MNISYNWLKEYVDFDMAPEEVSAALTSIGLETDGVEEVQTIKGGPPISSPSIKPTGSLFIYSLITSLIKAYLSLHS